MKKVLFISYYWPPSGKASIHWPLKIMKHLPNFEWLPVVLTVDEDTFSQKDETLIKEVPKAINVYRAKSFEPFNIYKKLTGKEKNERLVASETISTKNKSLAHRLSVWIRMNLFIPDARIGWYFPALKKGLDILKNEKIDAVVSIGVQYDRVRSQAHWYSRHLTLSWPFSDIALAGQRSMQRPHFSFT